MDDAAENGNAAEERATRVLVAAIECFGLGGRATRWLTTPNPILEWDVPLAVAKKSEEDCQLVCDVLKVLRGLDRRREE